MNRFVAVAIAVLVVGCFEDAPPVEDDGGTGSSGGDDSPTSMSTGDATGPTTPSTTDDDDTTDGPSDDTTDDGTTGAPECPPNAVCVPPVPPAWLGPVAFAVDGLQTPTCGGTYPTPIAMLHEGLDIADSTCGCTCSGPSPGCSGSIVTYDDLGCEGSTSAALPADPGECIGIIATIPSIGVVQFGGAVQACEPTASQELGAWSWANDVAVCGTAEAAPSCGDGVCAPVPDGPITTSCIYRDGVHECPNEDYDALHRFHADAADSRTCSDCECQLAAPNCAPQLWLSDDVAACSDPEGPFAPMCVGLGDHDAAYWLPTDPGDCAAGPTSLRGDVTPTGTVTVCCRA